MKMNKFDLRSKIYFILAGGVFVISFAGIFVAVADAPPLVIAFYRMFISMMALSPVIFLREDCGAGIFADRRPVIVGFFLAIHFFLWVTAFEYTAVANAVIFVALQPIFTLIFEAFWAKEDLQRGIIIGVIISVAGSFIVGAGDIHNLFANLRGDILAIAAAFFAGLYLFSGRSLRREMSYFPYILSVYFYASIFLFFGIILTGHSLTGHGSQNWMLFFGLALGPTLIGHSVLNLSVRYVPTTIVSVAIIGEPILTTLLAWILLGESVPGLTLAGGAIILTGVAYTISRRPAPE